MLSLPRTLVPILVPMSEFITFCWCSESVSYRSQLRWLCTRCWIRVWSLTAVLITLWSPRLWTSKSLPVQWSAFPSEALTSLDCFWTASAPRALMPR